MNGVGSLNGRPRNSIAIGPLVGLVLPAGTSRAGRPVTELNGLSWSTVFFQMPRRRHRFERIQQNVEAVLVHQLDGGLLKDFLGVAALEEIRLMRQRIELVIALDDGINLACVDDRNNMWRAVQI